MKHRLVGFSVDGDVVPPPGAEVVPSNADRPAGELTSSVFSPTLGRPIALGFVHVKHEAAGTGVHLRWGDSEAPAIVATLPFVES